MFPVESWPITGIKHKYAHYEPKTGYVYASWTHGGSMDCIGKVDSKMAAEKLAEDFAGIRGRYPEQKEWHNMTPYEVRTLIQSHLQAGRPVVQDGEALCFTSPHTGETYKVMFPSEDYAWEFLTIETERLAQ